MQFLGWEFRVPGGENEDIDTLNRFRLRATHYSVVFLSLHLARHLPEACPL